MNTKIETKYLGNGGFSLIEVMVSVFVLSVGILGLAGMQAVGVKESQNSYFRTQADLLAADMIERMRANRVGALDVTSPYVSDGTAVGNPPLCGESASNCTEAQIASFDLAAWQTDLTASSLPSAVGVITRSGATMEYTVQVFWDEDRDGSAGRGCNPAVAADMSCIRFVVHI